MRKFAVPRIAHCKEGHGRVLDTTENCPSQFSRKGGDGRCGN